MHYSEHTSILLLRAITVYPTPRHVKLLLKARRGSPGLPYHRTAGTLPLKLAPEVSYPNSQEEGDSPRSPLSLVCTYTL